MREKVLEAKIECLSDVLARILVCNEVITTDRLRGPELLLYGEEYIKIIEEKNKKSELRCPYCSKEHCIPDVVYRHAESYGGGIHHVACLHCHKIIEIASRRAARVEIIGKSENKDSDW